MDNIKVMTEFTEILKNKPYAAYGFIEENYSCFEKADFVKIIEQFLIAIPTYCGAEAFDVLNNVAIELDEQYGEQYQEG
jgi:hypothetical protein